MSVVNTFDLGFYKSLYCEAANSGVVVVFTSGNFTPLPKTAESEHDETLNYSRYLKVETGTQTFQNPFLISRHELSIAKYRHVLGGHRASSCVGTLLAALWKRSILDVAQLCSTWHDKTVLEKQINNARCDLAHLKIASGKAP